MASLVYHAINTSDQISPFDDAILRVAQTGSVKIVSPYIGLAYLKRIIDFSSDWMLISDIEAWLASLSARDRLMATAFIGKNKAHIHHVPSIHAKTVIGEHLAFLGSANLTTTGVLARTEMSVLLDEPELVREMHSWFDGLWQRSDSPRIEEVQALTRWLDGEESRSTTGKPAPPLSSVSRKVSAILSSVEDVRPLVSDISRERAADVQSDLSRVVLESTKNGPPMDTGWTGLTPAERSDAKNASTVPLVVENVMNQGLAVSPESQSTKPEQAAPAELELPQEPNPGSEPLGAPADVPNQAGAHDSAKQEKRPFETLTRQLMRLTAKKYDKSDVRENSGESRVQFIPHGHKTDLAYAHLSRAQKRLDVRVVLGNSDKAYSHLLKMVISTGNILPYETRALLFDHLSKKTGIPRKYMHSIFNSGRGKEVLLSVILVKSQKMTCCVKAHICSADYMNKLPKAKALLDQIPESILPRELPLSARGSEDRPNV